MTGTTEDSMNTAGAAAEGTTRPARTRPAAPAGKRKHPSHGARVVALVSSVTATVGVGAALGFADHAAASTTATASSATPAATSASGSSTSASTGAAATTATTAAAATSGTSSTAATGSTSTAAAASTTTGYADGSYTGASEYTRWGNYQVKVTIKNGKIVSVVETQAPTDSRSVAINNRAQPVLESEAIAAQSAKINAVSGATYTSTTYKASLQSALDQAAKAAVASA